MADIDVTYEPLTPVVDLEQAVQPTSARVHDDVEANIAIIVTLFTAGHEKTLPIWFYNELFRPRERPITIVVAVIVMLVTLVPILLAY